MSLPRPEYPRPELVRPDWMNLNGPWSFEFDDEDQGIREGWFERPSFSRTIQVPFPFQAALSGIGETGFHDVFWYHREVEVPAAWRERGRLLLHVGAFDYRGQLWVNGKKAGQHQGGYTPWTVDVTDFARQGRLNLVFRGVDTQSKSQPRGKQHWELSSSGIMYTRVSGLWQTVWLEPVPDSYIRSLRIVPELNPDRIRLSVEVEGPTPKGRVACSVRDAHQEVAREEAAVKDGNAEMEIVIPSARRWCPNDPCLYDLHLALLSGSESVDRVRSYAGVREIRTQGRQLLLNGRPIRFKSVLDQGYFPGGIYTAASDEDYKRDIELVRAMGFNGVRKHQKVEDPRWYAFCDRLGLLVWGEMGNTWEFTPEARDALRQEWQEVMRRDWNHPCIIAWVPINESWGVPDVQRDREQQQFQADMARLTRRMDPTRPVVDNSGWHHVDTDIVDVHPYVDEPAKLGALLDELRATGSGGEHYPTEVWVGGAAYEGQPIVISEYGGIALEADTEPAKGAGGGWGYGRHAASGEQLLRKFEALTREILRRADIAGYTYTQLTDVEQEVNGLLTFDRRPKVPVEELARAQTEGPENK